MSKELVKEAIGRPKKEQVVILKAQNLFKSSETTKYRIEAHKESIKKDLIYLEELEKHLQMLRDNKYKIKPCEWGELKLSVIFDKEEEF